MAEALEMSGGFVDANEVALLNMGAEILDTLKRLEPAEQLKQLTQRFAQELVDGTKGEEERAVAELRKPRVEQAGQAARPGTSRETTDPQRTKRMEPMVCPQTPETPLHLEKHT